MTRFQHFVISAAKELHREPINTVVARYKPVLDSLVDDSAHDAERQRDSQADHFRRDLHLARNEALKATNKRRAEHYIREAANGLAAQENNLYERINVELSNAV